MAGRFEGYRRAVPAAMMALHASDGGGIGDELVIGSLELGPTHREQVLRAHFEQLVARIAEGIADSLIYVHVAHGLALDQQDHVPRAVQGEAELALQRLLAACPELADEP